MDISSAIDKIHEIAEKNSVRLERSPEAFFQNRTKPLFTTPAIDPRGNRMIFRFGFGRLIQSILKEIFIYKYAKDHELAAFPLLTASENFDEYAWLTYAYLDGPVIGNVYQYDSEADLTQVIETLCFLSKIQRQDFPDIFKSRDQQSWHNLLDEIVDKDPALLEESAKVLYELLLKLPVPASNNLVHGDLHPGNVINTQFGLKVIDWESSHFDSFGFDLSFLYVRSFSDTRRQEIIRRFQSETSEHQYGFCYSLGVNLLRDYFEWSLIRSGKNELMNINQILPSTNYESITDDLRQQIENIAQILRNM